MQKHTNIFGAFEAQKRNIAKFRVILRRFIQTAIWVHTHTFSLCKIYKAGRKQLTSFRAMLGLGAAGQFLKGYQLFI